MIILKTYLIALLFIAGNAVSWAQVIGKDLIENDRNERDRRAIDFGLFVRNLLLKSATASNAKANISRNILNLKTATATPVRRTTTTTTTTVAPFFFNKGPFRFPFDLSAPINNKFKGGYINFDYDYGSQQPIRPARRRRPTTTTTTTTTAAPPATTTALPPRRRPIPRRPYGFFGKQKSPFFDYYYDEYDYNYDDANNTPANNAPPANQAPPPAPPPPPATAPAPSPAPNPPSPPPARPVKQPTANRNRAQGRAPQLRNRLVYQFRQPTDTSTNNNAAQQPAADEGSQQTPNTNASNNNNDETSTNANDVVYDDVDSVDSDANDDDGAANNGVADSNNNNNISDDNYPNTELDYNDSSDNANQNPNNRNGNVSASPPPPPPLSNSNFDFNANVPPFQGHFGIGGQPNPSGFGNFVASGGFPYPPYNNFNSHYQPSSPAGYSVRYY